LEREVLTPSTPLLKLFSSLGIDTGAAAAVETSSSFNHVFHISGTAAVAPSDDDLVDVANAFAGAVTVEFRTAGMPELTLVPGVEQADIASFRTRVATAPDIEVAVSIDKPRFVERLFGVEATGAVLFVFVAAFERELRSGLGAVASGLWAAHPGRLVVLVLDTDVDLHGRCLHVLGGASLPAQIDVSTLPSIAPAALERVAGLRDRLVGWNEPFGGMLTPWHVVASGTGPHTLQAALDARLLDLTLLYTCDRARRLEDGPTASIAAEFRGRDHVSTVLFAERDVVDIGDLERGALLSAVDWVYELDAVTQERPDWAPNRLPFLQTRVAQVLEGSSGDRRLAFVRELPAILEGVRWMWKAFIEEKVSSYLDEVKGLEEIVADTTEKLSGSIGDLAKSLSDTMLAAVAVLIGTFIAAAFDSPFNERLFRLGVLTYGGYVALFPGVVGLFSAWRQRCRAEDSFTYRRSSFEAALGANRVSDIVGERIDSVTQSFKMTLAAVAAVYVLLVVGAVVAAVAVPDFISHDRPPAVDT
jgi:hypothetical protein